MQRTRGGYTIIEVLVVLAVGIIIFIAAVTLFAGKQGKTQFSQAMRDVESRIRSIVNDVGVSTFPEASNYSCTVEPTGDGPRPKLDDATPGATGTNTDCIFLGKAIFLDTNTDNNTPDVITAYTVLGRRTGPSGVVTNFSDANPEPVLDKDDLIETYNIPYVAKVRSAEENVQSIPTYLVGFYNSLQSTMPTVAAGSQSVTMRGYPGIDSAAKGQIQNAVRGNLPVANSKVWTICFQSGTSDEFAKLLVNSTSAGVTTEVKYVTSCS